jgi:hypothetical protein
MTWITLILTLLRSLPELIAVVKQIIALIRGLKGEEKKLAKKEVINAAKEAAKTKNAGPLKRLLAKLRGETLAE